MAYTALNYHHRSPRVWSSLDYALTSLRRYCGDSLVEKAFWLYKRDCNRYAIMIVRVLLKQATVSPTAARDIFPLVNLDVYTYG